MRKTALGLAVALVLVLAFALAFWLAGGGEGSRSAGPAGEAPPPAALASELAAPAAPLAGPGAAEPRPEAAEIALPSAEERARRDAENPLAVPGFVVLPAGMPADDTLAVEVFLEEPKELLRLDPLLEEKLHDRSPVGADGRFELRLPEGTQACWAVARGRYLIAEAQRVELPRAEPLELRPRLGAWITGRVALPRGAAPGEDEEWTAELVPDPVAQMGAMNPVWNNGEEPLRRRSAPIEKAAAGTAEWAFELRGVRPATAYTLEIKPASVAADKTGPFDAAAGEHVELALAPGLGGTIAGRVTDAAGKGIAGAEIEVLQDPLMFGQGGFEVREGQSAEDGSFVLAHVRAGKLTLRFEARGFIDESETLELAEGQRASGLAVVLDSGASVAGRVTWPDGTPAAGIEVEVDFDPSFLGGLEAFNAMRGAEGESETDADGRFAVTGLGKGPFLVKAEAERGTDGESPWRARASAVKPGTADLVLVLEPPIGVAGRVVDDLGAPVIEFQVHARTKTSGMLAGLGAETASGDFEDPEGEFLLEGLRAGDWEAFATAEGHCAPDPVAFQMPREEGSELLLVLERAASVAGTVLGPDGAPVAGARVGKKRELADFSRLALEGGKAPSATTDGQGRFLLQGLAPVAQELIAEHPDFAPSAAFAVDLAPAEARTDVVLALRTGGRILGVIYDGEGDPWQGQTILCQDPTLQRGQRWATSDGAGAFAFDHLAPGTYQVMTLPRAGEAPGADDGEADGSDFAAMFADMKFTMADVEEGEDTHVELGAKPANPVRIQGRVTAAGAGVQGAMVSFIADGGGGFDSMRFTNTEAEGRFELELVKPGGYLVTVQKMIGTGQQQSYEILHEVPEAEEHQLSIELPLGGISGQVRGPDGSPIAGARVSLAIDGPVSNGSFTGGNYAEIWTDDDGRYDLVWLKPGTYSVAAGGAFLGGMFGDGGTETFGRSVRRGIQVDEGEQVRGVDFRLSRPGSIAGRVTDASGSPVADAAIFLRDDEGNPLDRISMTATDAGGRFEYGGLEPGSYHVQARTSALVSGSSATVRVREGEQSEVALVLEGGTVLVVSLSDAEGNSVRCRVTVTDEDGNQVNGLWSLNDLMSALSGGNFSSDEQRVGPLPPGKYTIEAIAEDGRDAHKTVTLSGQEERPIRLRLD